MTPPTRTGSLHSELPTSTAATRDPAWWQPVFFAALAGALGWGIRGQYGHETGAMMAGLLTSLTLALVLCPQAPSLSVARAVAWCTVAVGIGGSMTYGQTIGLTQNAPVIGNPAALAWGMTGLAIKGGLWIGFAGTFLGMGLGGKRYHPLELAAVIAGLLALFFLGVWLFNSPFDPAQRRLPALYFSADWHWEPNAENLKPRPEVWGGLLLALAGLIAYTTAWRRDPLAWRLAAWGVLGGALGFPAGQSLQSFHAWHLDWFRSEAMAPTDRIINWWNFMETTFGAVWAGTLGLGAWIHRRRIHLDHDAAIEAAEKAFPPGLEWSLLAVHGTLLLLSEFTDLPATAFYTEIALILGALPIVAVAGGRLWPYLLMLPVTLGPIAGKTINALLESTAFPAGVWALGLLPAVVAFSVALALAWRIPPDSHARRFLRPTLALTTWTYFVLNFFFFRLPWPWAPWTVRTPNALVFLVCALGLTLLVWRSGRRDPSLVDATPRAKPEAQST